MSTDLDAVRKAYKGGVEAWAEASVVGTSSHDAGLTAVVEWAMNRAADQVDRLGHNWSGTIATALFHDAETLRAYSAALLSDLTDNTERNN